MECFLKTGKTVERLATNHLCGKLSYSTRPNTYVTIFLYSWESWVLYLDMESKINTFATSCHKIMFGIKRQDCISNNVTYSMTNTELFVSYVRKCQLGFLWNILRLPKEEPTRRWQKEGGTYTHLLHHIHPSGVRISWSWYISRWDLPKIDVHTEIM